MCSIFPNKCTHSVFWAWSKRKKDERKCRENAGRMVCPMFTNRHHNHIENVPLNKGLRPMIYPLWECDYSAKILKKEQRSGGQSYCELPQSFARKAFPHQYNHFKKISHVTFSSWISSILQTVDRFWKYVNSRSDRQKYLQINVKVNILRQKRPIKIIPFIKGFKTEGAWTSWSTSRTSLQLCSVSQRAKSRRIIAYIMLSCMPDFRQC